MDDVSWPESFESTYSTLPLAAVRDLHVVVDCSADGGVLFDKFCF
jgi:hypothetical protein